MREKTPSGLLLLAIDSKGALNADLWQLVLNDDCFSRTNCEDCVTGAVGCGWCHNNDKGFKVGFSSVRVLNIVVHRWCVLRTIPSRRLRKRFRDNLDRRVLDLSS